MKKLFLLSFVLIFTSCVANSPQEPEPTPTHTPEQTIDFTLATWNIRILSDGSRTDEELTQIASILDDYDLIAIQEVRDTVVMQRLSDMLPEYSYLVSAAVGDSVTERYAFMYRTDLVTALGTPYILCDSADQFIREPYIAHFRIGTFDFTLITIHVLYGTEPERREEIKHLDDVLSVVDTANGDENDVFLMGDFNFPATESSFEITTYTAIIPATEMTTITDTSSYDNIWYNPSESAEKLPGYTIFKFDEDIFGNDDDAASLAVSDHRPVSITFTTDGVDDDAEGDWSSTAACLPGIAPTATPAPTPTTSTAGDIRFESVTADPTDSEQITIKNYSIWTVDLSGWTIGDLNNPTAYNIPNGLTLTPGESHQFVHSTLGFGINNSGETLYLRDANGLDVDTWSN